MAAKLCTAKKLRYTVVQTSGGVNLINAFAPSPQTKLVNSVQVISQLLTYIRSALGVLVFKVRKFGYGLFYTARMNFVCTYVYGIQLGFYVHTIS